MTERPSMIGRPELAEGASAAERADALRGNLRGLRDVDALLAEAGRLKREAAAEADQLVAEAQALSAELVREAEERAQGHVREAEKRAEGIVAVAADEADAVRARMELVLVGIEGSVRELGSHLEGALRSVNALSARLESVRSEPEPEPAAQREPSPPAEVEVEATALPAATPEEERPSSSVVYRQDDGEEGARPLGWLFRQTSA